MSDQGYTPTTELVYGCFTPEEWQEQMFTEVKVAYRLIEVYGPPDVDATPYDAEFAAAMDAEFDRWLAEVRREAAVKALREAHADLQAYAESGAPFGGGRLEDFLLRRADEIEKGASGG